MSHLFTISAVAPINYMIVSAIMFTIGLSGIIINRKSLITILMSIEIMLLAINLNFVTASTLYDGLQAAMGQIFVIFVMTVAATEVAIGLAILVVFFRNKSSIEIDDTSELKG